MRNLLLSIFLLVISVPIYANNILVLGDSLSAAYGINPDKGWVVLLQKRLQEKNYNIKVINQSISGNTTAQGLARFPDALKNAKPSITIIELGANDGLRGLSLHTFKENLIKLITLAKEANSKVLLVGFKLPPQYKDEYSAAFQKVYLDVARQEAIHLVPLIFKSFDEDPTYFQADRLHPTEAAQAKILDNLWSELAKML